MSCKDVCAPVHQSNCKVRCYHCKLKLIDGKDAITHAFEVHPNEKFSLYVQQEGNSYVHKSYVWRPINHVQSTLTLDEETWKVICKSESDIFNSPLKKQLKLSFTPTKTTKQSVVDESASLREFSDSAESKGIGNRPRNNRTLADEVDGSLDAESLLDIESLTADIMPFLQSSGRHDSWVNFIKLIKNGKFPCDNISFHLFMDVVDWYSSESIHAMRYTDTVKRFWSLGYKLFRERFLRFMGGFKNQGQISAGEKKGSLTADTSKVNFVAPSVNVLQKEMQKSDLDCAKPGLIKTNMHNLSPDKSYKLCIDGKRINTGFGKSLGDVDLYGHEPIPTLKSREKRHANEDKAFDEVSNILRARSGLGESDIGTEHLPSNCLRGLLAQTSERIKELRLMQTKKELSLEYLKKSRDKWSTSNFEFALSSAQTSIFRIKDCIQQTVQALNELCKEIAVLSDAGDLYVNGTLVELDRQPNFHCLLGIDVEENAVQDEELFETLLENSIYVKQRSNQWMFLRSKFRITGSTLYKAIGLGSLKKQKEHFEHVINGKAYDEPSDEQKSAMQHGTDNEINGVGTLVGKVLPVLFPNVVFKEIGCKAINRNGKPFMIISPDGEGTEKPEKSETSVAFEIKCPTPGKRYTPQVHYKVPLYYIPQCLSEMKALNCSTLIYLCYTEQSSTVFQLSFDSVLWESLDNCAAHLYEHETASKPTRLLPELKDLRKCLEEYADSQIVFLGEFPSAKSIMCRHTEAEGNMYGVHHQRVQGTRTLNIESTMETVFKLKSCVSKAYNILRVPAKEVLVTLVTDLDRMKQDDTPYAVPVSYGLSGYSLPVENVRCLLHEILKEFRQKNIQVPVISFDGQFYKLAVRDRHGNPLTILQLQKNTWETTKKIPRVQLLEYIVKANTVPQMTNLEDVREHVHIVTNTCEVNGKATFCGQIQVGSIKDAEKACLITPPNLSTWVNKRQSTKETLEEEDLDERNSEVDYIMPYLPPEVLGQLTDDAVQMIRNINMEVTRLSSKSADDNISQESLDQLYEDTSTNHPTESNDNVSDRSNEIHADAPLRNNNTSSITSEHIKAMIVKLKEGCTKRRQKTWNTTTEDDMCNILSQVENICKLTCHELIICLNSIPKYILLEKKISYSVKSNKEHLVVTMCTLLGLKNMTMLNARRRMKKVVQLKNIAIDVLKRKYSKMALNVIVATNMFHKIDLPKWKAAGVFKDSIMIQGETTLTDGYVWYSQPEITESNDVCFSLLDPHHLFVNARCSVCRSGFDGFGVNKEAWMEVCNDPINVAGLSVAIVKDLIDRQSNAYAQRVFSESVEESMITKGWVNEAHFCNMFRNWYRAEDEVGLSSSERHEFRMVLRDWLLHHARLGKFPPYGGNIKGMSTVMFEGILTNIDRRIQLYAVAKSGTYNVRALGSLDSETFFSTFQDLDSKGQGILHPDEVPKVLQTATYLTQAHCDAERGFFLHTSRPKVYVSHPLLARSPTINIHNQQHLPLNDTRIISLRDHMFDDPCRRKKKPKRKKSVITPLDQPGRGAQPVRQHHRCDETKIMPHVRHRLQLNESD